MSASVSVSYTHLDVYKRQTCASMHSRNRRAGILIGKGYTMEEAMNEVKMVVEGVYSAKAALGLAHKYETSMPVSYTHLDVYKRQHNILAVNIIS